MRGRDSRDGGFLRLNDESGHTGGPLGGLIKPVWSERHATFDLLALPVVENVVPGLRPDFSPSSTTPVTLGSSLYISQ